MVAILAAKFFVISFASLIFLKYPANNLFWNNIRTEPSSLTPILYLSSFLFSCLSLIFLSFFVCLLSSLPPESGSDPES